MGKMVMIMEGEQVKEREKQEGESKKGQPMMNSDFEIASETSDKTGFEKRNKMKKKDGNEDDNQLRKR